ncbi:MAG: NAD(P)-binding protein [Deltaproteobacteria bacterium]|nr:NAD(P)-binding protein [Deltaproteobacteria bacterium]
MLSLVGCFGGKTRGEKAPKAEPLETKSAVRESSKTVDENVYDAIIVGGGLSGLSAAFELSDYRVLLVEKEDRLGGRVLTLSHGEIKYDMGAVSGYRNKELPFGSSPPELIREKGPMGVNYQGQTRYCSEIRDCIQQLAKIDPALSEILAWNKMAGKPLSKSSKTLIKALFNVYHSGEMFRYNAKRHYDAFLPLRTTHFEDGNQALVDRFRERITAEISLTSTAVAVEDQGDLVRVVYRENGEEKSATARTAIVATPANAAAKIVKQMDSGARSFLDNLEYGRFVVVAVGLQDAESENFSYMVTPDLPATMILKQTSKQKNVDVALVYYGDAAAKKLEEKSDQEIAEDALATVGRFFAIKKESVLFSSVRRWKTGGTIISPMSYGKWMDSYNTPSKRVFLAGDYLKRKKGIPYGIISAVRSGKSAANSARKLIRPPCYDVDGIYLTRIPNSQTIKYISRIRPPVFGLVGGGAKSVDWINSVDEDDFGYKFERLYGHKDFETIIGIDGKNLDIIGYCPFGEEVSTEQFATRIKALKEKFPGKKILIGPCIDLFERVIASREKPHVLGFELFEKDFNDYLHGKYDPLIEKILAERTDVYNFPTFGKRVNLSKLERVMERATLRKLKLGYTMYGTKRVLGFLERTQCKP